MSHTILFVQPSDLKSRSFSDFESLNDCVEGVCKMYEEHLKTANPDSTTITYSIEELFRFIDQLSDLSCLVFQRITNSYAPYNKEWIKAKIYELLRQAAKSDNNTNGDTLNEKNDVNHLI